MCSKVIKSNDFLIRYWVCVSLCWFIPERSWRDGVCLYTSPYTAPCFHDLSAHAWSLLTAHPPLPLSQPPGALRRMCGHGHTHTHTNKINIFFQKPPFESFDQVTTNQFLIVILHRTDKAVTPLFFCFAYCFIDLK